MTGEPAVSLDEQITELKREVAIRERVYPQWIKRGDMHPSVALRQQRRMKAALRTLEELKASLGTKQLSG